MGFDESTHSLGRGNPPFFVAKIQNFVDACLCLAKIQTHSYSSL